VPALPTLVRTGSSRGTGNGEHKIFGSSAKLVRSVQKPDGFPDPRCILDIGTQDDERIPYEGMTRRLRISAATRQRSNAAQVRIRPPPGVPPGQTDLRDDRDTASELFFVVNFIVDQMITKPRKLVEIHTKLPPEKRKSIEERNARAGSEGS
jgi:hypothetical protein